MATVSQMARMQSYQNQNQFSFLNNSTNGKSQSLSMDDLRAIGKKNADKFFEELKATGYLVESGDTSYQVEIPISDEVKQAVYDQIRHDYTKNQGMALEHEKGIGEISYEYTQTIEPKDRLSAGYTINLLRLEVCSQYKAKINETNPNWPYDGSSYDPSIFDGWSPSTLNVTA